MLATSFSVVPSRSPPAGERDATGDLLNLAAAGYNGDVVVAFAGIEREIARKANAGSGRKGNLSIVGATMRLSDAIQEAIRLSEASRAYWDRELPKRHPDYPLIRHEEDSGPPPPEDAQLDALLRGLSEEQVYALILLMYVGRGDYPSDHLAESYQAMKETFPEPALAISQMTGKGSLGEYLRDGLEELHKRRVNVDSLTLAPSPASSHS